MVSGATGKPAEQAPARRRGRAHRRRRHLPQSDLHQVVRRLPQGDRRPDQLPVDRLGRRHPPVHRGHGGLRRHRRPDDRRADRRRRRATSCTSPPCSARWSSPTTCRSSARRRCASTARPWPTSSSAGSPSGTTPGSPALNPGVSLPAADIIVVHRSDGSGTASSSPTTCPRCRPTWKSKVGSATSVEWPIGLGGKGNEGVTQQVKQSEGAIGYVELIYAVRNGLPYADDEECGRAVRASRRSRA